MSSTPSLFVSHTTRDRRDASLARYLGDELEKLGVKTWIAPKSLPIGKRWKERLVSAILDDCSHFLVIASAASMDAPWVLREVDLAKRRAQDDASFCVLPLVVGSLGESAALKFVEEFQQIPYSDNPHEQLKAAAAALGIKYEPPAQPADHLRAKEYLERGIEREKGALKDIRRIRVAAPAAGIALAAGMFLWEPAWWETWKAAVLSAPLVTGLTGWGATWRRFAEASNQLQKLEVMQDSLDVCMGIETSSCKEIWQAFWRYVEDRALGAT